MWGSVFIYLFIYDLSNDALSSSAYIPSYCMVMTESSIVRVAEGAAYLVLI
jgi:hypothetical protein